jgi:hypothetical protein
MEEKKGRKEATLEEGKMLARLSLAMLAAVLAATADVSPSRKVAFSSRCIFVASVYHHPLARPCSDAAECIFFGDRFRILGNMFVVSSSYRPLP